MIAGARVKSSCSPAASAARASRGRCSRWSSPRELTVVGNVGDDLEVLGLHVSPDLDTVLYTLSGLSDEERGWGREGETWNALATRRAARRRGVVPPRRPRPRAPPRANAGARRGRAALGGDGAADRGARRRDAPASRDRRPPAHVGRDPGRRASRSRTGSSRRGHADPVDGAALRRRRGRAARARACSRRCATPTRSCSRRATRSSASRRSSPCASCAPRSSAAARPRSRSAR